MNFYSRKFKNDDISVIINECADIVIKHLKYHEDIKAFKFEVSRNDCLTEIYYIEIENNNLNKFNSVVKKFLEDPSYRKNLFRGYAGVTGEILEDWVVPYNYNGVNLECVEQIKRINNAEIKKLKFKDFAELKTFGKDKFSNIKLKDIEPFLKEDDILMVQSDLKEEKLVLSALRWVARGLNVNCAIRKVKVDFEILNNNQKRVWYPVGFDRIKIILKQIKTTDKRTVVLF